MIGNVPFQSRKVKPPRRRDSIIERTHLGVRTTASVLISVANTLQERQFGVLDEKEVDMERATCLCRESGF